MAYGFASNPSLSISHNVSLQLQVMPIWYYFDRPTHLAFHDLTTNLSPPKNLQSLLGLGLKFCPAPRFSHSSVAKSFERFRRDLFCKTYFAGKDNVNADFDMKLHVSSTWCPLDWMIPNSIHRRLRNFTQSTNSLFKKKKCKPNLLWHQHIALSTLQKDHRFLVIHCDKNLGPAIIEKDVYIQRALSDHLLDTTSYRSLTPDQAMDMKTTIKSKILDWLKKYKKLLTAQERKFIRYHTNQSDTGLPVFYLSAKVHKTPWSTRPIISCSGSLLYSVGVWVDRQLQKVAIQQPSYIKNSKELKDLLLELVLPPGALLFTADAVSMYTNIDTEHALHSIGSYLQRYKRQFADIPLDALLEALALVMTHNVFSFGDTYWLQLSGTAMGTPPAPSYATIVYAIHEATLIAKYSRNLYFYKRYIDDVFGIWVPDLSHSVGDNITYAEFCSDMNYHRLRWDVSDRCSQVDFLDITITIQQDGRISTKLFEKALNLYLYIPPHSAHPPGVLTGLVLGNAYRIYTLCSNIHDTKVALQQFYYRLCARGYKRETLLPLFARAQQLFQPSSIIPTNQPPTVDDTSTKRLFFHLKYNPSDPRSNKIQKLWRLHMLHPPYEHHLSRVKNKDKVPIGIDQLTIAYLRPLNLGNLLSYRNLNRYSGPPVSSFLITNNEGLERERVRERERERERERAQGIV